MRIGYGRATVTGYETSTATLSEPVESTVEPVEGEGEGVGFTQPAGRVEAGSQETFLFMLVANNG